MAEHALEGKTVAPPRDWLRMASVALSILGMLVAGYLSYAELVGTGSMVCPSHGEMLFGLPIDCGSVNLSQYAKVGPMPVALLGLGGYITILGVLVLEDRLAILEEYGHFLFFGLTLFGFAFSIYLTWVEVTQIKAFCSWCVTSAVLMTLMFIIAVVRLWRKMNEDLDIE
ncbi:MAG: vitamin K epoxide reductase family protein [Anaerolineae bacterium]|nr:vitamin K epoxide reductase family protein [Anaerolineae bacterium]